MQVAGITNQQEIYVVSKDNPFKINQILIIEDKMQGILRGEVVETSSYNKFLSLNINGEMADREVLNSLKNLGYEVDENTIYIAKVRLIVEAKYPVATGSLVRVPSFSEVRDLLVSVNPENGLVLGVIKSTEELKTSLDPVFEDKLCLFENGNIQLQNGVPFVFDIKSMNQYPHIGIFGGSGSGKSFGMRVILEEIMKLNIPTVVLDPHYEMDFSQRSGLDSKYAIDFKDKFACLQIGRDIGIKFQDLNTRDLINIISSAAAGTLTDSMANVIQSLHEYRDSYLTFERRLNLLKEAFEIGNENKINKLLQEAQTKGEKERIRDLEDMLEVFKKNSSIPAASLNGVLWRLQRLYRDGIFTSDIRPVENNLLAGKTVIVQGPIKVLNVFSTYLISNLYYKRREYRDSKQRGEAAEFFPPFILAFDESHNFAPKGYETPSKSIIKEIAQEGRKYGVFLILATQRPALLDETITAQLNTKIVFRTVRASDIDIIKEETDITSEEAKRLPYLTSGDAFVSSAIIGRTVAIRVRMAMTTSSHGENPFDELDDMMNKKYREAYDRIKRVLPIMPTKFISVLDEIGSDVAPNVETLRNLLDNLVDKGYIDYKKTPLGDMYVAK
ncbi:AAA-like domain protein [Caloramator mitchellensis]|uniref:AAA-like domain protein n=1 Tax=Caloramator mitchellensis TaxID=908809 RepID=A0A0R3JYL9_CALMK|nr:ATP-binding protein [Caloramator mitchellensis]KRQ86334.1 AAA-like domain protein [Caloramator mitchellensis]